MSTIKENWRSISGYWHRYLWRDTVTRLMTVNFLVWVVVSIGYLCASNPQQWVGWFAIPGHIGDVPSRLWTVFTYMFTHVDFMHMFVNMTWLLLFGQLFCHILDGRRLFVIYIYGGLCGACAFVLYSLKSPLGIGLLGASASVLAVIGAVMVMAPQWRIPLFIFGEVKVIWIAIVALVFFVLLQPGVVIFAVHLSGMSIGALYALLRRQNVDIANPVLKLADAIKNKCRSAKTRQSSASLDELLAKVSRSGYSSLSPAERQRLFELSQKIK